MHDTCATHVIVFDLITKIIQLMFFISGIVHHGFICLQKTYFVNPCAWLVDPLHIGSYTHVGI